MLRLAIAFAGGGVIGVVVGIALGVFFYPFWFLADTTASESIAGATSAAQIIAARGAGGRGADLQFGGETGGGTVIPSPEEAEAAKAEAAEAEAAASLSLVSSGRFIHANPNDPVHWGAGEASLVEREGRLVVLLGDDFEVGPGPAYHVYVKDAAGIRSRSDFLDAEGPSIGKLRAFRGSQVYEVPEGIARESIRSVVVWCESFRVLISPADLEPVDGLSAPRVPGAARAKRRPRGPSAPAPVCPSARRP